MTNEQDIENTIAPPYGEIVTNEIKIDRTKFVENNTVSVKSVRIDHPSHYTWLKEKCGIEVIDIARHLDFCLGNAVKYILRAGHKTEEGLTDKEKAVEDLKKAAWYINDKINSLTNNK